LIIETPKKNLSRIMHFINSSYTTYVNVKRKRAGHLFQGRYKAILVDKDNYLFELSRYIHLNPVRAKMVSKPEEYSYSSYCSYVTSKSESIVTTDVILKMLRVKSKEAPGRYRNFVESIMGKEMANPLQKVYGRIILGGKRFIREVMQRMEINPVQTAQEISRAGSLLSNVSPQEVISACCEYYGVTREELLRSSRGESRKHVFI